MKEIKQGATSLAAIAYDNRGRRASQTRLAGVDTTYGYDNASRLSSLTDAMAGTGQDLTTTLGYNPSSQITIRTRSNDAFVISQAAASKTYNVNGLNQYTSVAGQAYGYDSDGNLRNDPGSASGSAGAVAFGYDAENRLVSASGARTASLKYDPLGRLYETGGSSGTTRYLYDGDELVVEYNAAGTIQRRYVHGASVDDPLVWYEGSGTAAGARRHMFSDSQGGIVSIADSSGNPLGINKYDDWGTPAAGNLGKFGYTGQLWLADAGVWHYKARAYSPYIGRFLQVDPVGYDDQVLLYAYVGNDPIDGRDPSGKCFEMSCPVNIFNEDASNKTKRAEADASENLAKALYTASGAEDLVNTIKNPTPGGVIMAIIGITPAGKVDKLLDAAKQLEKGAAKKLANAAEHERRADAFAKNPTVRPGMEGQPKSVIREQQRVREQHLRNEARDFRKQAEEDQKKAQELRTRAARGSEE